jgi:FAD/FMN-containing dehydrogenase
MAAMKRRTLLQGALIGGLGTNTLLHTLYVSAADSGKEAVVLTLSGGEHTVGRADLLGLQSRLQGHLLQQDDEAYGAARLLYNASIDRYPSLIAQCANSADVVAAVRFASERNLLTTVRGGGHSISGRSVADRGLLIDLGFINDVTINRPQKIAQVGGGARLGQLDRASVAQNLVTTAGTDSDTGVGGLTLGGGLGRLDRKFGLTIDNLLGAELVTAEGKVIYTDAESHPDLFWAIRGGGGNFGVATRFDFKLHDFDPIVYGGDIVFHWDQRRDVMQYLAEIEADLPDAMTLAPQLGNSPDAGQITALHVCHAGDHGEAERLLKPLRQQFKVLRDDARPRPYIDMQATPPGPRHAVYLKSSLVNGLTEGVIDALCEHFPTDAERVIWSQHLGGAVSRVGSSDTAYNHREAHYNIGIMAAFTDLSRFDEFRASVRQQFAELEPHTSGFYTNLMSRGQEKTEANFGDNLARLRQIKSTYDPGNFFRMNANIRPNTVGAPQA